MLRCWEVSLSFTARASNLLHFIQIDGIHVRLDLHHPPAPQAVDVSAPIASCQAVAIKLDTHKHRSPSRTPPTSDARMAPYQKPTVEEVEDEYRRKCSENGIRIQPFELPSTAFSSAMAEAKRLRKRKCPWDNTQRLSKMVAVPAHCR